jgi:hypothetical protein
LKEEISGHAGVPGGREPKSDAIDSRFKSCSNYPPLLRR